ncbi:MAG: DMT family transporter, partial [Actinomycetes bacterium]
MTALWALVVIVNKKVLEDVHPVAVNFLVRIVAAVGIVCITVPLTVLHLWSNGLGINAAAAGWVALSAVATWLIAFNAYYYALRGGLIAVIAPISSTDPLWTAVFAWLILGTAFGRLTVAGMAVAMAGVLLISRWMDAGGEVGAGAIAGASHGEVLSAGAASFDATPAGPRGLTTTGLAPAADSRARLITLAVVAAAGWGIGPV